MIVCDSCHSNILNKYYTDVWGHKVCAFHIEQGEIVYCSTCSGFAQANSKLIDGRVLCLDCKSSAEKQYDNIKRVTTIVIKHLKDIGFNDLNIDDISIEIQSAQFIANLRDGIVNPNVRGLVRSQTSTSFSIFGSSTTMQHTVYLLKFQPSVEMTATLAHELLHSWQIQNNIKPPSDLCEGLCNLGSYSILEKISTPLSKKLIENLMNDPDPIYGDGFRKVYNVFQQTGWSKLIDIYKNNNFQQLKKSKIMVNEQRFAGESAQNFEQKCLCVLVLDASGSMKGEPLNALNDALKSFWSDIMNNVGVAESLKDQIELGVIQFDQEPKILREPTLLVEGEEAPIVTERGSTTDTVAALREAIQMVDDRKAFYKSSGQPYFRPWIILMTDGAATSTQAEIDDMSNIIKTKLDSKAFTIIGLGAGGYNDAELKKLAPATLALAGTKFAEFFKWLSCSMSAVSQSSDGDKIDLVNDQFKAFQVN